jgi:hypothetical protein
VHLTNERIENKIEYSLLWIESIGHTMNDTGMKLLAKAHCSSDTERAELMVLHIAKTGTDSWEEDFS